MVDRSSPVLLALLTLQVGKCHFQEAAGMLPGLFLLLPAVLLQYAKRPLLLEFLAVAAL